MYLLWFNALRVLHRIWTGPWRRRVSRDPSNPHGRAVPQAASSGTGVQKASRAISRCGKWVPSDPLLQGASVCFLNYCYTTVGTTSWGDIAGPGAGVVYEHL